MILSNNGFRWEFWESHKVASLLYFLLSKNFLVKTSQLIYLTPNLAQLRALSKFCHQDFPRWLWLAKVSLTLTSLVTESESCSIMSDSLQPHGLFTAHGILQARILEWVAFPSSRGSSKLRARTQVSRIAGGFFTSWTTGEAPSCH